MSTLLADTITNVAGSSAGTTITIDKDSTYNSEGTAVTQNLVQGLAKVYCCNDGSGNIENSQSMNVSGTTDNGAADITISYTNNFSSASHTWAWTGALDGGNDDASSRKRQTTSDTGNLRYICCYSGTLYEWAEQSSTMHGGLA